MADRESKVLSLKEHARLVRQQAYQRAKEYRAKDPRFLAMKEEAKRQRRALYQEVKAKRKAAAKVEKVEVAKRRTEARAEARAETYQDLMKLVNVGAAARPPRIEN
jgi:hypothetical protein